MSDLVWLEENAVPRWVHRKFYRPWSGPCRVDKVISNISYRVQCEKVAPFRVGRKTRMIVHFNGLNPYKASPAQIQQIVEEVATQPKDLNV